MPCWLVLCPGSLALSTSRIHHVPDHRAMDLSDVAGNPRESRAEFDKQRDPVKLEMELLDKYVPSPQGNMRCVSNGRRNPGWSARKSKTERLYALKNRSEYHGKLHEPSMEDKKRENGNAKKSCKKIKEKRTSFSTCLTNGCERIPSCKRRVKTLHREKAKFEEHKLSIFCGHVGGVQANEAVVVR